MGVSSSKDGRQRESLSSSLTSSSSALAPILSSADTCDASYISRLSHKTQLATDRVTSAISGLIGEVTSAVGTVGRGVAKRQSRAEKALEMFSDELESCIKTLEGIHAQLTSAVDSNIVGVEGLYDITASLTTAASLVADTHQLPTASCALILGCVDVADALSSVHNQLSRVQLDVDPNRCVVSIPDGLRMKASAIVTVPFLDCEGDTISGVWLEDVTVMSPWSVGAPSLIGNMLSIPISVGADGKNTTALRVDIMTQAVEATIEFGFSVSSRHNRSIDVGGKGGSYLAVNPSGTRLALSAQRGSVLNILDLRTDAWQTISSMYARPKSITIYSPQRVCYLPATGGLHLVDKQASFFCVQEMTASYAYVGERLRCETLNSNPNDFGKEWNVVGIAANATSIALCTSNVWHRLGHQVFLYSVTDGAVLHSFGSKGRAQDQLQGPVSIRFSPDDYHLLIVDIVSNRLSLFTFAGEFVRCIGVGVLKRPTDAVFAHNGDIIVADCGNRRLCAFSPDGDTLLHTLMFPWPDTRSFRSPFSLAVHRRLLYVLDTDRDTVHVIEYK